MKARFALFAFGRYYPNGGFDDLRGIYESVEDCCVKFDSIIPEIMDEQGYGKCESNGQCYAQIVDLDTMELVKELEK